MGNEGEAVSGVCRVLLEARALRLWVPRRLTCPSTDGFWGVFRQLPRQTAVTWGALVEGGRSLCGSWLLVEGGKRASLGLALCGHSCTGSTTRREKDGGLRLCGSECVGMHGGLDGSWMGGWMVAEWGAGWGLDGGPDGGMGVSVTVSKP